MQHILSIQSHVAYGFVGNRAAVFPLQRMGHDAWAVNTVQFSNHTGYGAWTGDVFGPAQVAALVDGVEARGVLPSCDAVLSGYMGSAELGGVILDAVRRVRAANPGALYCCDPVMGDVGRGIFVRPGLPDFIRGAAVPAADIITPNQFELEYLTGRTIRYLDDALDAAAAARALGPKVVVVTSLTRADAPADRIEMMADTADGTWITATPRLPLDPPPNGAGDAVAALFLAEYLETGSCEAALRHATAAIFAVFRQTQLAGTRELALIAAQAELARPTTLFEPVRIR